MNRILLALSFCLISLVSVSAQTGETASFIESGIASWYGAEFEGRKTASGEIFNTKLLTAAHPKLPFGTILRVTNTQNNKSVLVRVNDRGPFVAARILDVSRAAAEKLDMIVTGTAPVRIESISSPEVQPAPISAVASEVEPKEAPLVVPPLVEQKASTAFRLIPKEPSASSGKKYRLQLGSYKISNNAAETFNRLKTAGLNPSYEHSGDLYRVVLAFVDAKDLTALTEKLSSAGFSEALVREER
ncbi:septal ring lytic transglycosylase RlpA family protein [Treponema sp.]